MPKRYLVASSPDRGELSFQYPADVASFKMVELAGGMSKLSDEQKEQVRLKRVKSGDDCSDMPATSLVIYLGRGWVVEEKASVEVAPVEVTPVEVVPVEEVISNG